MNTRPYRKNERARQQDATKRRIVEATSALHAEVGPAATTISAIAERAGVQRLTVYRHFPDERALFEACSALSDERHPVPDPSSWAGITDPGERSEAALRALYTYYAGDAHALQLVLRDAQTLPTLGEVISPFWGYLQQVADDLATSWKNDNGDSRELRAITSFAVDFQTWRSLDARGLAPHECARLIAALVRLVAQTEPVSDRTQNDH